MLPKSQETFTVISMPELSMFTLKCHSYFLFKEAHRSFQALHGRWC